MGYYDISLNGISGIEAAERHQNHYPKLSVLSFDARESQFTGRAALRAGASGYI